MADKSKLDNDGQKDSNASRTTSGVPPKRPLTKPIPPRSSTLTKPTSTSTARTTTGTSLNKPPARPAISSTRKPPSTTNTTTTTPTHRQQSSINSVEKELSPEEGNKDGISAKPRRASLSASTGPETTSTTKPSSSTPTSRPNIPLTSTRRTTTTTSPPSSKRPLTSTRTSLDTSVRPKPMTSTSSRSSALLQDKKRLSTIPASPAIKAPPAKLKEDKENDTTPTNSQSPVRPSLGTRKSTKSVLIEQRISEFELVNKMLQTAMAAEGADDDEQQSIEQEANKTIAKLRADLARVRAFEKQHGRIPNEDELAKAGPELHDEMQELASAKENVSALESDRTKKLETELADQREEVEILQSRLKDMTLKMQELESAPTQGSPDENSNEHAKQITELTSTHEQQLKDLSNNHRQELESIKHAHKGELETLQKDHDDLRVQSKAEVEKERNSIGARMSTQETEISDLQLQIKNLRIERSAIVASKENEINKLKTEADAAKIKLEEADQTEAHEQEISKLQEVIKEEQAKSATALKDAETKSTQFRDLEEKLTESKTLNDQKITELRSKLDRAENDVTNKQGENSKLREAHAKALENIDNEMSRQTQVIKTLQNELVAFNESKANESSEQNAKIQGLEEEILRMEQMKEDTSKQFAIALEEHQGNSKKELETLDARLKAATEDLEKSNTSHEASKREALLAAETQVSAARSELETLKKMQDESIETLQEQLRSTQEQFETQRKSHAEEITMLQSHLETSQKTLKEFTAKHEEQIKLFESQASRVQEQLAETIAGHEKALQQQATEARKAHEEALQDLKKTHKEQVIGLEAQVKEFESTVGKSKLEHAEELRKYQAESARVQAEALDALKATHAKQVNELESQSKASQEESVTKMQETYLEQISQLESRSKSMAADLDAARYQVQSLKGIFQSVEEEAKGKDDEHAKVLEKLEAELSTSVQKMAEQSSRMADLQQEHHHSLDEVKRAIQAEHEESLKSLQSEHDNAITKIQKDLESRNASLITKMQEEHDKKIASTLESSSTQSQQTNQKLQAEYDEKVQHLEKTMQADHSASTIELNREHSKILSSKDEEHSTALRNAKDDHEAAVAKLTAELEGAKKASQNVTSEAETNELRNKLANAQKVTGELEQKHAQEMQQMKESHESALATMQTEIEKSLVDMQKQIDKKTEDLRSKNQAEKDALESDLAEARRKLENHKDSQTELEKLEKELSGSKEKVLELDEQLQGAMLEIETQRTMADDAAEEVEQLKAHPSKSVEKEVSSPRAETGDLEPSEQSLDHKASNTPTSAKSGLESSRWAVNEDEKENNSSNSIKPNGKAQSKDGGKETEAKLPTNGHDDNQGKRRNLEGQLASIQEQIKHLDEISGDFLEEHERMAKTLSRHDDTTSTPLTTS